MQKGVEMAEDFLEGIEPRTAQTPVERFERVGLALGARRPWR